MKLGPINRYLIFGLRSVDGWLDLYSAEFIWMLADIQRNAGISGSVGEIGVHHGKLFILLLLTASENERALAIDVFENQHLNVDASGLGDRNAFLSNVRRWAGNDNRVEIIARSSLDVLPEEILTKIGRLRLVSIDGGHTEECTINDLRLIEKCLSPEGIVIVDDYFNPLWPDVSTGVARYLLDRGSALRPFAISPNKVYLTAPKNIEFYRSRISAYAQFKLAKTSRMFETEVAIYGFALKTGTLRQLMKGIVKESAAGPYLLAFKALINGTGKN